MNHPRLSKIQRGAPDQGRIRRAMPEPLSSTTSRPDIRKFPERRGTFEMRNRAMLRLIWILPTLMIAAGLMTPAPASAQAVCPPTINACGCTIATPGSYKLGLNIDSTQGLTPAGACIEIASNFVILDGAKKTITGPGGTTPTGIGVWVHRNIRQDFLGFRGSV